jgi:uncharacterized protein YecE (DUF72 family)
MSIEKSSSLRIGTAGWSYPHWNGIVYPRHQAGGFHPLDVLAEQVGAVEVNSSFYQFLKPELATLWMRRTERYPDFRFTAKLHQRFTHSRIVEDSGVRLFKEGLLPLLRAGKLGALLMQFPWSFRFTAENQEFLIRLRRAFHEFPLVAEMRHASWLAEEAQGTFLDYKIGFCNIDQPEYTSAMPPTALLTSGIGYVRLHGRNPRNALGSFDRAAGGEAGTRLKQHDYLYTPAELDEWAKLIERIHKFADATFVIFNNDAGAKSVVNALEMQERLLGVHPAAPKELRRRYPAELVQFSPAHMEQQLLFPAA